MARLRHYHPPLTANLMGFAMRWGTADRTLRTAFVVAGSLTVSLVYLCGVSLFTLTGPRSPESRRRTAPDLRRAFAIRFIAAACAAILICTPAHLRASSHALPWALITLWLLALLWTLLKLAETQRPAWLIVTGLALGALFVTSEYAVPALIAVGIGLPFAAWPLLQDRRKAPRVVRGLLGGAVLFLVVVFTIWPAGFTGGMVKMLGHYADMANDPWPVRVYGVEYSKAPKIAYAVWYWDLFKPFLVFYALGAIGAVGALLFGRGRASVMMTLGFTGVVLTVAHVSHIIGPEYLVHALPLLTLLGGLFFVLLADLQWIVGILVVAIAAGLVCSQYDPSLLAGMDERSRHSRWPAAARFIVSRWKSEDRMLAPSYGGPGRWYVLRVAGANAREWQILGLPASGERAGDRILSDIHRGLYRFVVVGSTFMDYAGLDSRIERELMSWKKVWSSDEKGAGKSRLVIYERMVH